MPAREIVLIPWRRRKQIRGKRSAALKANTGAIARSHRTRLTFSRGEGEAVRSKRLGGMKRTEKKEPAPKGENRSKKLRHTRKHKKRFTVGETVHRRYLKGKCTFIDTERGRGG